MRAHRAPVSLLPLLLGSALAVGCESGEDADGGGAGTTATWMAGTGGYAAGTGGAGTGGDTSTGGFGMAGSGGEGGEAGATGGSGGIAGTGGDGGTGGDAGTGGDGGTGGSAQLGSPGCGIASAQPQEAWQSHALGARSYEVRLPGNYDSGRPYPVVLQLHGCGMPTNNVPIESQTGEDAIVIRGQGSDGTCWSVDADLPYVDDMVAHVQANFCVNPDALFAVGYSSGSWLASRLSCARADVFRGIGTVTGGWPGGSETCNGQVGRIFVHDVNDNDNKIEWDTPSRDLMVSNNHCDTTTTSVDPAPCVAYDNCDPGYPVVWCQTSGKGHSRQDELAPAAFWSFFQSLMQ